MLVFEKQLLTFYKTACLTPRHICAFMILPQLNPLYRSRSVPPNTHTAAVKHWLCSSSWHSSLITTVPGSTVEAGPMQTHMLDSPWRDSQRCISCISCVLSVSLLCKQDHCGVTLGWQYVYEQLDSNWKYLCVACREINENEQLQWNDIHSILSYMCLCLDFDVNFWLHLHLTLLQDLDAILSIGLTSDLGWELGGMSGYEKL